MGVMGRTGFPGMNVRPSYVPRYVGTYVTLELLLQGAAGDPGLMGEDGTPGSEVSYI